MRKTSITERYAPDKPDSNTDWSKGIRCHPKYFRAMYQEFKSFTHEEVRQRLAREYGQKLDGVVQYFPPKS